MSDQNVVKEGWVQKRGEILLSTEPRRSPPDRPIQLIDLLPAGVCAAELHCCPKDPLDTSPSCWFPPSHGGDTF